uniref:DNA-directed DNA polymerase family B exonuclease domain-containing protein n=1 Tax=Anopheles atroparvus TaxID=41427 RepID=A0AAG5D4U5_ANOAO
MSSQETKSIRIVSVDHYMSKPDPQYDVCYSQFRGSEIRQVPVIRLFGTTAEGTHSCVHIHGVFPYFYIPYEGSTSDQLAVDKRIYQLATTIDKAINVSLARSMSRATHIFKIVLVKGIPIYGFHRNEHNYLKIYMYNPRLVRNATTLLTNGAISSVKPQVHETHIPYVLQFFIDYNLYGMSFLHLHAKGLRQRTNAVETDDGDVPKKMSTSEYEIDVLASDILNREPEEKDTGEFANPGIASIWKDEETRRRLFGLEQPEKSNLSQDDGSGKEIVTESDRFYRAMLTTKLLKERAGENPQKGTSSASYPSEATEGVATLDASHIADHGRSHGHSNDSLYASQISFHFDASAEIDEEKIVYMSQNVDASLREEDYNLLEIMRELEENEKRNFEGDCLLAPLTQQSGENNRTIVQGCPSGGLNVSQANRRLNASLCGDLEALCLMQELENAGTANTQNDSFDSDDEFLMDLTQKQQSARNVDLEGLDGYLNDSGDEDLLAGGCIPQLDGGDDLFASRTPKRNRNSNEPTPDISSLAKRIRIDLTQPTSRKSLTPRKVTFAPSPPGDEHVQRAEIIRKQFEQSSPNTLKNLEIRVPKLSLMKKSILSRKSTPCFEKPQPEMPLKSLRVRLTKLDPGAYEKPKQPVIFIGDRNRQAYEHDKRNNFVPLEGPSTLQSNRVRKPNPAKTGPSRPKRQKLEEQQEIEVVLSERFKNIIRLSPKVLIKPLSMIQNAAVINCQPTVSTAAASGPKPIAIDEESTNSMEAIDEERSKQSVGVDKSPTPEAEEVTPVETPSATENGEVDGKVTQPDSSRIDDVSDNEPINVEETDKENVMAVDNGTDDDCVENPPTIGIRPVRSAEPMVTIHLDLEDESLSNTLALAGNSKKTFIETSEFLFHDLISPQDGSSKRTAASPNLSSSVLIGNQLDGVVEPMEEGEKEKDPESPTEVEEEENVTQIQSFCETTMVCDVDEIESDSDDSCYVVTCNQEVEEEDARRVRIALASCPPTREQAQEAIETFEIPAVVNATPFYSNPDDLTGKKEVGHTVLHITGNSLNDMEEFKSSIAGLQSMKHLRYAQLEQSFGESIDEVLGPVGPNGPNGDRMKELLASERSVTITHAKAPPSRAEADAWLDEKFRNRQPDLTTTKGDAVEVDSPTKVKKADAIMTVEPSIEKPSASQTNIDSESSLNLSVLLTNDRDKSSSPCSSTKSLVSKIMAINTYGAGSTPDTGSKCTFDGEKTQEGTTLAGYSARVKNRMLSGKRSMQRGSSTVRDISELRDVTPTSLDEVVADPAAEEEMINSTKINEKLEESGKTPRKESPNEELREKDVVDATQAPCVMASSDQSDLIEQSNANISMATAPDNAYGFKVDYENLQRAKPGCEVS